MSLYKKIGLKYEALTLVTLAFQVPMPPFQPAVFPPEFRELPPPQLKLFDLDDAYATHEVQLAQLTNKCDANELDLYIREAGVILGINRTLANQWPRSAMDLPQTKASMAKMAYSRQLLFEKHKQKLLERFNNRGKAEKYQQNDNNKAKGTKGGRRRPLVILAEEERKSLERDEQLAEGCLKTLIDH